MTAGRTGLRWASSGPRSTSWSTPAYSTSAAVTSIETPVWSAVHGLAVLAGEGPLRDVPEASRRHLENLTLTFIERAWPAPASYQPVRA